MQQGFSARVVGRWVETTVDESGGSKQQYVEDCQVCCQPFTITAELES
jgi:hypothetical protein